MQMLVFGATILASVFLVLVQQPDRESATWLLYVAAVWALLLPVTSFVQVAPYAPHAATCWTSHSQQTPVMQAMSCALSGWDTRTLQDYLRKLQMTSHDMCRQIRICHLFREIFSACIASPIWCWMRSALLPSGDCPTHSEQ